MVLFNRYYRHQKISDTKEVASIIKKKQNSSHFEEFVNLASFDKSVCVEIVNDSFQSVYNSSFFGKGCFSSKEQTANYKYDFIGSNLENATYELVNPKFNNDSLVYAMKLENNQYAFINTTLEPIDGTVSILRSQLLAMSVLLLILSFLLAYFISNHISNPIVKITKSAKKLANGEFDADFHADTKISELRELTETLTYAKEELGKTDELRRDLMANVSHDLKTPLTMIKAYAEMSRDLHKNNEKKQSEDMNTIIEEVDRLTLLVNDILDLSKMQSNIEELHFEDFNLVEMIQEIIQQYDVLRELENYCFKFSCRKKKIMVRADREKIKQVIYNLINNAVQYTGSDNTITIRVSEQDEVLVEIIDTGKGIKEEDLPYIWDKYYKNQKKHKRNLVGTGLGLSIVKSILELHQYPYGVKTKEKHGTTFYFTIKKEEHLK